MNRYLPCSRTSDHPLKHPARSLNHYRVPRESEYDSYFLGKMDYVSTTAIYVLWAVLCEESTDDIILPRDEPPVGSYGSFLGRISDSSTRCMEVRRVMTCRLMKAIMNNAVMIRMIVGAGALSRKKLA